MKEKVSLTIEGEVWREYRSLCIKQKKSASSTLEAFMRSQLAATDQQPNRPKKK